MQAWVFRHLDELRPIYGVRTGRASAPGAETTPGALQGLAPAPGTVARRPGDASQAVVVAAPMKRRGQRRR